MTIVNQPQLLLIYDDLELCELLQKYLTIANDGEAGLAEARQKQ